MNNEARIFPDSVITHGNISINSEGCAICKGDCLIMSTFFRNHERNPAFSFQFVDFELSEVPTINFGIKSQSKRASKEDSTLFSFSYFDFLSTFRSSASPLIPYDGIGVVIHMIAESDSFKIYVNNEYSRFPAKNMQTQCYYFLEIVQEGSCEILLPFHSPNVQIPNSFFPNLIPRLWTCLPFLIQIRGFNIRGNSNLRSVYSEVPLANLPGYPNIKYFEVIIRSVSANSSNHSGVYIGFVERPHAAAECPPGRSRLSIGFSTLSKTICVACEDSDVQIGPISSGHVIGLGINKKDIFMTYDGALTDPDTFPDPGFSQYFPVVSVVGSSDEVIINLGQLPFKYEAISPPSYWCLYNKGDQYTSHFEKGPPPESHIQNYFPFTSMIGSPSYFETFVYSKPLKPTSSAEGHFELTILSKSNDDVIMIGLSGGDYIQGSPVGWDKKTLGIHSDDGMLYRESGTRGKKNIVDPNEITKGKTIGVSLQGNNVFFTVGKDKYSVANDFNTPAFPTISAYGQISFIANYGESPFAFTSTNVETDGVKLYNGVIVKMTNNDLDKVGLSPGDYIEYRDLSLRGLFLGELKNRYYVAIEGIDGAVPLQEQDPLILKTSIKVLYSHNRKSGLLKPMITFSDCIMATLGIFERRSLYASRYGIAFLIGQTPEGSYVMRPIVDLMNNSHCFVLDEKPPNILKSVHPEINPVFFQHGISFLDVIEDGDQTLMLMLGSQNGQIVGWNNTSIVPLKGDHVKIIFRFNGLSFFSINNGLRVNVGMQRGGKYFPPNYHGTTGSQFFQKSISQRSYGSKGMMPIPPAVNLLLTSLNEEFTINSETVASRSVTSPTLGLSMVYDIEDDTEEKPNELPLITVSKAKK